MNQSLGIFVAKCGDNDFRYAISKSTGHVNSYPKQYFHDKTKSFTSLDEAMNMGIITSVSMGIENIVTEYVGDFSKLFSYDDEWDNHVGDVIGF
jgi:hypothetical protein